jgi:hypothetical protein
MLNISHRGNLYGQDKNRENNPKAIEECIIKGLDVEIDICIVNGKPFLGHDEPEHEISYNYLNDLSDNLWVHCKDYEALIFCQDSPNINYFTHDNDQYTLTSKNFIWSHPKNGPIERAINVMPEKYLKSTDAKHFNAYLDCLGICTDIIGKLT